MSVTGVFSGGRASGHPSATSILRYLPRPRVPWQPSRFARRNLAAEDLQAMWSKGRYRSGPGNYNSGYSTATTHTLEDNTISVIPRAELEKYMPNIALGGKALVTPVSLMSARAGHRVTHDMLHAYDPHIGRLDQPAQVCHDAITVRDASCVGLHAAALDCRGRVHRWLRRGPFFQEDHYFRRSTTSSNSKSNSGGAAGQTQRKRTGEVPGVLASEAALAARVIRLAQRGQIRLACEEYRRFVGVPPVTVYRALTAACSSARLLADAVAVLEDGHARLFYVSRDGEVLYHVLQCAMACGHVGRVMWVYNLMRGRYYENVVVRAEVGVLWQYRLAARALEFLLDRGAAEEAQMVYDYLATDLATAAPAGSVRTGSHGCGSRSGKEDSCRDAEDAKDSNDEIQAIVGDDGAMSCLLDCDVAIRMGQRMREALAEGSAVQLRPDTAAGMALVKNVTLVAPRVAATVYERFCQQVRSSHTGDASTPSNDACEEKSREGWTSGQDGRQWLGEEGCRSLDDPSSLSPSVALTWLQERFPDVRVAAILRLARFRRERVDLMAHHRSRYCLRAAQWLELLSRVHRHRCEVPLPYLRKSRPSMMTHDDTSSSTSGLLSSSYGSATPTSVVRVLANDDEEHGVPGRGSSSSSCRLHHNLTETRPAGSFFYDPRMRMVVESLAVGNGGRGGVMGASLWAAEPVHTEVPVAVSYHVSEGGSGSSSAVSQQSGNWRCLGGPISEKTAPVNLEQRSNTQSISTAPLF